MPSDFRRLFRMGAFGITLWLSLLIGFSPASVLAADACGSSSPPDAGLSSGDESGIGGTGIRESRPDQMNATGDDSESGIGGTGIFGTVTQTNPLCVNGLEIRIAQQLHSQVQTQGQGQHQSLGAHAGFDEQQLAIGQVVWIHAMDSEGGLVASSIEIHPGLSGEIEQIVKQGRGLVLQGQAVEVSDHTELNAELRGYPLAVGQSIIVHGLHDDQDRLIASRIQTDTTHRNADDHADPTPAAEQWLARRLAKIAATRRVSIEGYVRMDSTRLTLNGLQMELDPSRPIPQKQTLHPGRHITVEGRVLQEGVLRIDRARSHGRAGRPTTKQGHRPQMIEPTSGEAPVIERSPGSPTPAIPKPKGPTTRPTPPRNPNERGHLPPKRQPHRADRPESRPSSVADKPFILDRPSR